MKILAIDTSTEGCSVALWSSGIIYAHFERCFLEHAKRILHIVQEILNQGNITLNELDALAFSRGPGSFTGIRIGIGITQGLAMGVTIPVVGISTLAIMAQGAWRKTRATNVLAAIDARMGEIYWAEYIRDKYGIWHGEQTEALLKPNDVRKRLQNLSNGWVMVGNGWQNLSEIISNNTLLNVVNGYTLFPEAKDMLPIAYHLLTTGQGVSAENIEAVYLRNKVTRK